MEEVLRDLDRRVGRIEQILPTLVTKDDLQKAIAPLATKEELRNAVAGLATKEELRNAVAGLATKEEVRAEGERTRAHFDAVAERLEEQIRLLAEGLLSLTRQFEEFKAETNARFAEMDRRLARLEARYAES
jgi:hypothetical protein